MPVSATAYERVLWNNSVGYSTSTFGNNEKLVSGSNAIYGIYVIDCAGAGIAEIASTTVSLYTDSSTRNAFRIRDLQSGRRSDQGYTITNTATPYSYTFTPPLWCSGKSVLLAGDSYATRLVNWSVKGANADPTEPDDVPHAWCMGSDTGCVMGGNVGKDIAIIAIGSFATATPTTSGGSTTTYNFYTATTSPTEAIEQLTTVHLAFALIIVLFLTAIITYTFTYGRSRPT